MLAPRGATLPLLAVACLSRVPGAQALGTVALPFYALFFLFVVWSICFLGIMWLFITFRARFKAQYEEAKRVGLVLEDENVVEDLPEDEVIDEAGAVGALGFLSFPDSETSHEMGLDASLYLAHAMQCAKFWMFHSCTLGIVLILTYQIAGNKTTYTRYVDASDTHPAQNITLTDSWVDFYSFSIGTLKCDEEECTWAIIIPIIGSFWFVFTNLVFVAWRQKLMDTIKVAADGQSVHSSVYTIMLRGVDKTTDTEDFKRYFEAGYPEHINNVHIALDYTGLQKNVRAQTHVIRQMNKIVDDGGEKKDDYSSLEVQRKALEAEEPALRDMDHPSTGIIFVTFDEEVNARQFIADHKAHTVADELGIKEGKCQLAPLACDMYWENIAVTRGERYVKMVWTWSATFAIFSVFILMACGMVFCIGFDYMEILYNAKGLPEFTKPVHAVKETLGLFMFYVVCTTVLAISFLFLEEEIPHIVKYFTKYEQYMSKTKKQSAYMFKCYLHYLIYHLVISTFFLGLLTKMVDSANRPRLFMEISGCFHCNRMMLTVAIIDAFHWCEGLKFFRRPISVTDEDSAEAVFHSAEEMDDDDDAIECAADAFFNNHFNFSRNYAESTAVFGAASYYAINTPLIQFFAIIYFGGKYALDKYQIVHQYSKPHFAFGRRARSTTTYLLTSMVAGRSGDMIYFSYVKYSAIPCIGFTICFFLSCLMLTLYVHRNKLFKKDSGVGKAARAATGKATGRKDAAESKQAKIDELRDTPRDTEEATEDFNEVYNPPSSESLVVKVDLMDIKDAVKKVDPGEPDVNTSELEMPPDVEAGTTDVKNPMADNEEEE